MKKTILCLGLLLTTFTAYADRYIESGDDTAVITGLCLYDEADGINKITNITSEDAGLKITLTGQTRSTQLIYDAAGEIEDITTLGTWSAPSASNVRFEVDPNTGCYELQFAANSFEDGLYSLITIEDTSSPTFMDADFTVHSWAPNFVALLSGTDDVATTRDMGQPLGPTTISSFTAQDVFRVADGATNDDAYAIGSSVYINDGTEDCQQTLADYDGTNKEITLQGACPSLTISGGETVRIAGAASPVYVASILATHDTKLDTVDQNVDDVETAVGNLNDFNPTTEGVNVDRLGGVAQSLTDLKDFADAGYDPATDKVQGVVLVDLTTANTDMRGTDGANTTTPPTAIAIRDAILGATIDGTIDFECAMALNLAYGTGKWTTAGAVATYRNPGDTANRIVGTIGASSFDTITLTCP